MQSQFGKHALLICLLSSFVACDSANFGGEGGGLSTKKDNPKKENEQIATAPDDQEKDIDDVDQIKPVELDNTSDGNATSVFDDVEAGLRKEVFSFGPKAKAPMVDFVFVIDNSVSMQEILTNTASGFDSLANDDVWPTRSMISVMSTMVGDRSNLTKTHPGISRYNGIDSEPGFLDFVDEKSIKSFRSVAAKGVLDKWSIDGCAGKWFKPEEKNANGQSCFKSHTQSTNHAVGCEAGITAVAQFLEKNKGKSRFRKGALVNIIFVSDTHDPGCDNKDLKNNIPSLDAIKTKLSADNSVVGLKFHALAPDDKCTSEDLNGESYFPLITATKGLKNDPCKIKDYSAFIKDMVVEAVKPESGVFIMSKTPTKILKVLVDGKAVTDYVFEKDTGILTISSLSNTSDQKIEVTYKY